jgi:uncharacterized membrane protein YfcA
MGLIEIIVLALLGVAAGVISSMVGGASLITFPVLLTVGLNPLTAAVANTLALTPGNFLAWIYDRGQLPPSDRSFWVLIAVSLVGALIGAALLIATPLRVLYLLVPILLGFATAVFAFSRQIEGWIARRAAASGERGGRWGSTNAALFPVSVYGGYFGSGVGVLLLAVLSIGSGGDYRATNVLKNFVTSLNSTVACVVYLVSGVIVWEPALAMMVGCLLGAYMGARWAKTAPRDSMRRIIIALSTLLTLASAWRYWL